MNVSRELLQQNPELHAMRSALTRRALDMLQKLVNKEGDDYVAFWANFGAVFKEGMVEDHSNKDKIAKLLRFASTHDSSGKQSQGLDDYLSRMTDGQDEIYYLLADNYATAAASPHLEQLRDKGIEVLLLTDPIDPWVVDHLTEYEGKALADVAREQLSLPQSDGEISRVAIDDEHKPLLKKIKKALRERTETVNISRRLVDSPACVVSAADELSPPIRRMLAASGQAVPATTPLLEINIEHPLVARLSAAKDDTRFSELSNIVLDHALLAEGSQLDNPAEYVRRMNHLLLELDSNSGSTQ